jgi:dienelactone hydrolase
MFDLQTHQYKRYLTIDPLATLRSITWADDETALVTISFMEDLGAPRANWSGHDVRNWEIFRTIAADTTHSPGRLLLMSDDRRKTITGSDLVCWRTSKPKTVLMATLDVDYRWESQTPPAYSLFEVDTVSGKGRLVQRGTPLTTDWVADQTGQRLARKEEVAPSRGEFVFQVFLESNWRDIFHGKENDRLTLIGFSADGTGVVAAGVIGEGRRKLWRLPLDGSQPTLLFEDPGSDVEYVTVDHVTGAPRAVELGGTVPHARFLDPVSQARADMLDRSFPGQLVEEYDTSEARKRALVRASGGSKPAVWYVVDFTTHKADIVGEEYPALGAASLGERTVISYKARDGQAIPAYLTLPPKAARQHLPLVVLVHGGPESRDFPGFDWWSQFLATRGYAVLQPQFRGSTGFGEAFRRAGYRQWGGLMQDDISDGVADLVSQGIADPQRVCIVGGNYGGYAALAGAAFTPTLYRCAVSVNGVSDISEMLAYHAHRHTAVAYWQEHVGSQFDPVLKQKSPMHAAERVNAPVLLLHASNDPVVPFSQSIAMAHALTVAHKSVQLVPLPGDDHWLSRSETRTRMLQEVEKFLAAHL